MCNNVCIFLFFKLCRHRFSQFNGIWRKKTHTTDEWLMKASTNRNPFQSEYSKCWFRYIDCLLYVSFFSHSLSLSPSLCATLSKSIKIQNYQILDLWFEKNHKFYRSYIRINEKRFEWILAVLRTDKELITGDELTAVRALSVYVFYMWLMFCFVYGVCLSVFEIDQHSKFDWKNRFAIMIFHRWICWCWWVRSFSLLSDTLRKPLELVGHVWVCVLMHS